MQWRLYVLKRGMFTALGEGCAVWGMHLANKLNCLLFCQKLPHALRGHDDEPVFLRQFSHAYIWLPLYQCMHWCGYEPKLPSMWVNAAACAQTRTCVYAQCACRGWWAAEVDDGSRMTRAPARLSVLRGSGRENE